MKHLSKEDFDVILESLKYTRFKFEEYTEYPNAEFKAQRIKNVVEIMEKVRNEIKDWDDKKSG